VLGPESGDVGHNVGIIPMSPEIPTHPGARVAEQCLMDEIDWRRRALDVQQDGAYVLQRDAAPRGM
jgi:hypothetical protein